MKNKEWEWIDLSVTGPDEAPVSHWPERWTTQALIARLNEIGSIEFDRSMRNVLHPDKERIVQEGWLTYFESEPPRSTLRISSWDFAASGGEGDWTARAVLDVNFEERKIYVLRVDRWQGLTYNEMIDLMLRDRDIWTPDKILIEQAGFQVIMGRDERIEILPEIVRITPKVNKEQRVKQTAVLYERGVIRFKSDTCQLAISELLGFPKAKNDDMVDALTQGVLFAIEQMGRPFRPGDASGKGERVFGLRDGGNVGPRSTHSSVSDTTPEFRGRVGFKDTKW